RDGRPLLPQQGEADEERDQRDRREMPNDPPDPPCRRVVGDVRDPRGERRRSRRDAGPKEHHGCAGGEVRGRREVGGDRGARSERSGRDHISRRPSRACERVTSSAYSRSPPTGRPLARRVTVTPTGLSSAATYIAVAFPSRFGFVAMMTSLTPFLSTRSRS